MDGMTFLGFVLMVAVGISVLGFTLGLLSPERESAVEATRPSTGVVAAESMAAAIPAFFAKPLSAQNPPATLGFDDALLALLQDHVKTERAIVNEFVHFPSVDSLYARPSLTMH